MSQFYCFVMYVSSRLVIPLYAMIKLICVIKLVLCASVFADLNHLLQAPTLVMNEGAAYGESHVILK